MADTVLCERCKAKLYYVDYDKLAKPIVGGMFKPRGGIPIRWKEWAGQDMMDCPICGDWVSTKWNYLWVVTDAGERKHIEAPAADPQETENANFKQCPKCGKEFRRRGIKTHIRYCKG